MRLSDLSLFLDVAQSGSMSRVAELRGASQPGISRIIRELERETGVILMHRNGRGIELTEAGKHFSCFAETCLREKAGLDTALAPLRGPQRKTLMIGVPIGTGWLIIPVLQRRLAREMPDLDVSVFEERTSTIPEAQLLSRYDLLLTYDTAADPVQTARQQALFEEPLFVVGSPGLIGAGETPLPPEQIAALPLMLPAKSAYRSFVEDRFRALGLSIHARRELETSEAMLAFAIEGDGVALLPLSNLLRELERGEIVARPIGAPGFSRRLFAKHRGSDPSKSERRAMGHLISVLRELAGQAGWSEPSTHQPSDVEYQG